MAVVDNELNWRKVFPDTGVDVSGWTMAQRMTLPDWCFGSREMVIGRRGNATPNSMLWGISSIALPDPACIWDFLIMVEANDYKFNKIRIGLSDTVPTSEAEMDAAQNIFPDFGDQAFTPPGINVSPVEGILYYMPLRRGLVTSGKKLVIESRVHVSGAILIASVQLSVSGLPTEIPAFLNPDIP